MQTDTGKPRRVVLRYLALMFIVLVGVQTASAQPASPRPATSPVVLVLKLVSKTHVKPTTGVVISNDGLVLIPADFVSAGDEIVVLDGGTDIFRYGRPAKTVRRSVADGLAVLSVEGLRRPAILVSADDPNAGNTLHLAAFPPAEEIAEGAQPLWSVVKVVPAGANGQLSISTQTPLPNITGPIIDQCGQLVALNLAQGPQSLQPSEKTFVLFARDLVRVLDEMQLSLSAANCTGNTVSEVTSDAVQPGDISDIPSSDTGKKAGTHDSSVAPKGNPVLTANELAAELNTGTEVGSTVDTGLDPGNGQRHANGNVADLPAPETGLDLSWLALPVALIVIVGAWVLVTYTRRDKDIEKYAGHGSGGSGRPPGTEEPDTARLETSPAITPAAPGATSIDAANMPDINALPPGCDGLVVVEGILADNTRIRQYCAVDTEHVDLIVGRGGADICIDTPAISRSHARVQADGDGMTLSDLGSSNGTAIRGIPCLAGEIMYIGVDDELLLGDVVLHVSMIRQARPEP